MTDTGDRIRKVRKLRALGRPGSGAFPHEAARALARAEELERKTPRAIAKAIAQTLQALGMKVRVRRRARIDDTLWFRQGLDADVSYLRDQIYIVLY
jgi:Protein of unknown function (DUF2786)